MRPTRPDKTSNEICTRNSARAALGRLTSRFRALKTVTTQVSTSGQVVESKLRPVWAVSSLNKLYSFGLLVWMLVAWYFLSLGIYLGLLLFGWGARYFIFSAIRGYLVHEARKARRLHRPPL
jgi:hypothetical protein